MRNACAAAVVVTAAAGVAGCAAISSSTGDNGGSAPTVESVTAPKREHRPAQTSRAARRPPARLPVSTASSTVVQRQPAAGSCHGRGSGLFSLPDRRCTPGAISPAVRQANIHSTICVSGYTKTVRPRESITEREKLANMASYGDTEPPHAYEYDHLVSLELGGAPNDARNLWPEPGASPNPKDRVEDRLHALVCDGDLTLASAQKQIAGDWVAVYHRLFG